MQFISLALLSVALVNAQQPGHQKQDAWPGLTVQQCSSSGCEDENSAIVLDSNWDWVHKKGTYTNCYTGNSWDPSFCPDAETCAENCALDAGSVEDYESSYGISTTGSTVQLNFVTQGADSPSANVGSRTYLLDGPTGASGYKMFKLKNREFTFDVDVSKLPCGLNGALYFVEMDQDGGMAKYPGNKAGAAYGTGYCDAQCPHDIKFINGEANLKNWSKSGSTTGTGHYGTCCTEMDIWESNSISQALTPHACSVKGQTRCEGLDCGDGDQRQQGVCDKDGCDFNPYRFGSKTFFGPGSSFQIDTTKPFTVVTQFVTEDGTDTGKLSEIRRVWVQDGKVINNPNVTVGGNSYNSISDEFCADQKKWTGDENTFAKRGGLSAVEGSFERGMVLVMSLWMITQRICCGSIPITH